jgi:signal peptidase I
MRPTLRDGQQVLARPCASDGPSLQRGDVVALRHPHSQGVVLIKRVVGLPGEHLRLAEDAVYLNDGPLAEPYLEGPPCPQGRYARQWLLDEGEYLVLGDNRGDSLDGRAFGPVGLELVLGRVWCRCWPPWAWGLVPSPPWKPSQGGR